ncbi:flagellar biosynthesis protein FliQ [Sphingomonas mollis]|uniref:Flagellar biosynthetic protein FliQ n=1 Tax=Sphingomonas mollis TaxID=2795726 RepID=A0ABS0XPX0_9SPHN|nr:flagellar biosynthesis protein FliQ [Sphingomonas sp. BT553]MBJ6122057.1 flagellar biosynthesis protein FliQ [Sphingomonas sp. BT553]
MTPGDTIDIAKATLVVVLTICGPLLLTALVVGMAVSLFQALTQVQEQTLTFLPKLVAMGIVMLLTLPMIGHALSDFTRVVSDHIIHG